MDDLVADGNSVLLVDHDTQMLSHADWIIEMGPGAGAEGGQVMAQGTVAEVAADPASRIGPFLSGTAQAPAAAADRSGGALFDLGRIHLSTGAIHTVKPLEADIPKGRLTVVTGVSGSGKTTLILESLVPGLEAHIAGRPLPAHVLDGGRRTASARVKLIDATPIGINVRSTVATYANVHDELRKIYARTPGGQGPGVQGRGLLLQHREAALPGLRRHRLHQPGRAVPAGRGHPLPGLPGLPVQPGRGARAGARPGPGRPSPCRS